MADRFGSTVLQEAGEAIGNVGRRVFRRRRRDVGEQALARWMAQVPLPQVSRSEAPRTTPDEGVIEATYQVIDDEKGTTP
jgi:hypothetical protein